MRKSGPPDSLFAQLGGFAIPLIGPGGDRQPGLDAAGVDHPAAGRPAAATAGRGDVRHHGPRPVDGTRLHQGGDGRSRTGERRPPNEFTNPTSNAAFLDTQLQSAGYFQLEDDDALVVTIDPGDAGYFVVPVTNDWTITENYWDQQTSLNNASNQAKPNADGTYTVVISKNDPGVDNWVSTGGLNQGTVSIRFQDLGDEAPMVSSKVVKIENLRDPDVLPADTVFIEPEDLAAYRAAQIATRQEGFNNRFAPFPQT